MSLEIQDRKAVYRPDQLADFATATEYVDDLRNLLIVGYAINYGVRDYDIGNDLQTG